MSKKQKRSDKQKRKLEADSHIIASNSSVICDDLVTSSDEEKYTIESLEQNIDLLDEMLTKDLQTSNHFPHLRMENHQISLPVSNTGNMHVNLAQCISRRRDSIVAHCVTSMSFQNERQVHPFCRTSTEDKSRFDDFNVCEDPIDIFFSQYADGFE